ncbi:LOW QUALITY PROTEIN: laminin subunit beta-2-like [Rhynchocyon petersi]
MICSYGGCYPPLGNLVIGRGRSLQASSTCGLHGPEPYCVINDLQDSEDCFFCDPGAQRGHSIENVIYWSNHGGEKTWWQAESGVENVTIQLDLEGAFYFTHLVMTFKTFRPAALLLERSVDYGHSWHLYRYFAHNCSSIFPGIPPAPGHRVSDIVCDQHYSDIEPSTEGKVIFKVLDPAIQVEDLNSPEIQGLQRVTNLRVNFSKLHTLGDRPLRSLKGHPLYYYAIYELDIQGSCLCHGHASECRPVPGAPTNMEGMVHAYCVCRHHTAGANCERCQDLHQDHPWHAAEPGHPHACRKCECHGHARSCHFDMAVYLASGNVSGGVCDACQHNTAGRHCQLCRPFFYRDLREDPRSPHSCRSCNCDPVGALEGGLCDTHTDEARGLLSGQCRCKGHVWGQRCDSCRPGHYGLSPTESQGCQPCRCDPRGRVPGTYACDPSSGTCLKRFVTGRDCSRCLPEFWGLSNDPPGCRPCDCDFGGAYSNRCSAGVGLCLCRPHFHGRRCHELQSGHFCAALDQATAEAELGKGLHPADPRLPGDPWPTPPHCIQAPGTSAGWLKHRLQRQRDPRCTFYPAWQKHHNRQLTNVKRNKIPAADLPRHQRAGPQQRHVLNFAHVVDGAGVSLLAPAVPRALEYDIVLRYETQVPEDWQALISIRAQSLPSSTRCAHVLPSEQVFQAALPHMHRAVALSRPFCFEPGTRYSMTMRLWRTKGVQRPDGGTILLDSVVLLPRVEELPGLRAVDPGAMQRLRELRQAGCMEAARMGPSSTMPEACTRLVCSISALLHGGGLACECHPQGSLSTECALLGGQCPCRPHVIGRTCDHCVPGTYGFGPAGCNECHCHAEGATSAICNPLSGQCACRAGIAGRRCDHCLPGRWGFPHCHLCACNGHAELCHPLTGICQDCQGATIGWHCERCLDGYYGDPVLGSGQQCRPCPCPSYPGSGLYYGSSCHVDNMSGRVLCLCVPGYAGPRCDRCSSGYFGRPWPGGDPRRSPCRPCQCNNNIDPRDPAACDPLSGHCQRCLHHSHGPGCAHCKPGFYGNALRTGGCRRCSCDPRGTVSTQCPSGTDVCFCNQVSGQCLCRPHTLGRDCNRCAPFFWNLGGPWGCEPCGCHAQHALQLMCHPVTGQCPCLAGFGGRTCSQCQDGYWGDPDQECRACACDPQGSISPSCDPHTGACLCRDGISGLRCQACAHRSRGDFPHCTSCPTCFTSWDQHLALLQLQMGAVAQEVTALHQGMPGQRNMTALAQTIQNTEHAVVDSRLWVRGQCERLEALSWELDCVKDLAWTKQVIGVQDAEAQTSSAALLSQEAMLRVRAVASFEQPDSVLGKAQETRQWTEKLLDLHCPGTLHTAQWALVASHNSSYNLDIAVAALEKHQQLVQSLEAVGEGADVASVELVAWHVLEVPLPQSRAAGIAFLLGQIQGYLPALGTIGQELPRAEGILHQAQQTRECTAKAQDQVLDIQGALAEVGIHTIAAEQGLQVAKEALRGLEGSVQEAAGHLTQMAQAVDLALVLGNGSHAAEALRMHLVLSQQQAQEAKEQSLRATSIAEGLDKELQVARLGFAELQEGASGLVAAVQDTKVRIHRIRAEAQELLKQAQSAWDHLERLERRLVQNELALTKKAATLQALEQRAAELLEYMQLSANTYATC